MQDMMLPELLEAPRDPAIPLPDSAGVEVSAANSEVALEVVRARRAEGKLLEAWILLKGVWAKWPQGEGALREVVTVGFEVCRYPEVLQACEALLGAGVSEAVVRLCGARAASALGDFKRAEALLQEAFDGAGEVQWHLAYGYFHEKRRAWGWAATAYKLALRYDPECEAAQCALVRVALAQGDLKTARAALAEVAGGLENVYLKGLLAQAEGDWRGAEEALMAVVKQAPWLREAWLALGVLRMGVERFTSAEYALRQAFLLAPELVEGRREFAQVCAKLGKEALAAKLLEGLDEVAPEPKQVKPLEAAVSEFAPSTAPIVAVPASERVVEASALKLNTYQNLAGTGQAPNPKTQEELNHHLELASQLMPGPMYRQYLQTIHQWMRPSTYVEIGIESGQTLAFASPGTRCVGIDPEPRLTVRLPETTRVFELPSDVFFAQENVEAVLGGPIEFAFIDGLHVFDQVLRDFMNVEKHSTSRTVIVLHDCFPINEITQRPQRETFFWTGDPWKIVPCLKEKRPDLEVMVIKTPPSGLAMVLGADPNNTVLHDDYAAIEKHYTNLPYAAIEADKDKALNAVPNDWAYVRERILAHRGKRC